ncbi:MAG: hypothetical protein J6U40_05390 [Kiritimatiellae bacterium]|nr:hypothetical protein [Kiritimatiellia bacterium]
MRGVGCGLVFLMGLAMGCVSHRVIEDTRKPELEITEFGILLVNGERVERGRLVKAMKRAGFTYDQEVNILVPDRPDRQLMKSVTGELVRGGYKRHVFVKNRRAMSDLPPTVQPGAAKGKPAVPTSARQPVRRTTPAGRR